MTARRYSSQDQAQPASRVERLDARAALSPPCSPPLVQPLHELHLRGIQPAADIGGKVCLPPCAPFVSQGAARHTRKRPSTPPRESPTIPHRAYISCPRSGGTSTGHDPRSRIDDDPVTYSQPPRSPGIVGIAPTARPP